MRDRELDSVARIVNALARIQEPVDAARVLLDEAEGLIDTDLNALALVNEDEDEAVGLLARSAGEDLAWWSEVRVHLHNEPSGIASAFFEAAPVSVYDVESSSVVSQRLARAANAKSAVFVPLIVEERVIGVLIAATTGERRAFATEEIRLLEALAGETAIALDRTRSASALDRALTRERLVAKISRRVRSVHDLDAITRVAVTETGRAIDATRCFIRLGEGGETMPIRAEWWADGLEPIGEAVASLPVSNLAGRERRTVAIPDVLDAPELGDPSLGSVESLSRARHARRARHAGDRLRPHDRRARAPPARARAVVAGRRGTGRGGRPRARPGAAHGEAAGRERTPARRAVGAAEGRPDGDQRARARRGAPAAGRRGGRAAAGRGGRLLPARPAAGSAPLRGGARLARRHRRLRVPGRPRPGRPRDRARAARGLRRLRESPRSRPAPGLRGLPRRDRRADALVGRGDGHPRRRHTRPGAAVHPGRRGAARGVRQPRRARAPQRGELRRAHAPGPDPARLLPDRCRPRPADLARGDLRRARPGRLRRARRRQRGRADAGRGRPAAGRDAQPAGPARAVPREGPRRPDRAARAARAQRARPYLAAARRRRALRRRPGERRARERLPCAAGRPGRGAAHRRVRGSSSSSSPRSGTSPTTTSSSPATSRGRPRRAPAKRAVRSRAAGPRARPAARAHRLALATELDPAAVLDEVVRQAPTLLGADAA